MRINANYQNRYNGYNQHPAFQANVHRYIKTDLLSRTRNDEELKYALLVLKNIEKTGDSNTVIKFDAYENFLVKNEVLDEFLGLDVPPRGAHDTNPILTNLLTITPQKIDKVEYDFFECIKDKIVKKNYNKFKNYIVNKTYPSKVKPGFEDRKAKAIEEIKKSSKP